VRKREKGGGKREREREREEERDSKILTGKTILRNLMFL